MQNLIMPQPLVAVSAVETSQYPLNPALSIYGNQGQAALQGSLEPWMVNSQLVNPNQVALENHMAMKGESIRVNSSTLYPDMTAESKKRKTAHQDHDVHGWLDDSDSKHDDDERRMGTGFLRLPDVIDKIAQEGTALQWDRQEAAYVVLDGRAFENRFNELRYTRGKKVDNARNRPFSRMPTHFTLIRGEKWAATGTMFRPKREDGKVLPSQHDWIDASTVRVTLGSSKDKFQISLQEFLDITGAGDLYADALQSKSDTLSSTTTTTPEHGDSTSNNSTPANDSPKHPSSPAKLPDALEDPSFALLSREPSRLLMMDQFGQDVMLDSNDVSAILGTIWNSDARGDQAYFFTRKAGIPPFANGAIVCLRDGLLEGDASRGSGCLYLIVSDKNAKWKGEPIPSPEEEEKGHWCCFLGQVPVVVEGSVSCGDYIGPMCDGSGKGRVVALGESPVIGIALVNKEDASAAVVKTMCFAGLNAISLSARMDEKSYKELFEQGRRMQEIVENVQRDVKEVNLRVGAVTQKVGDVEARVGTTDTTVRSLSNKLNANVEILESRLQNVERSVAFNFHRMIPMLPANDGEWHFQIAGGSCHCRFSKISRVFLVIVIVALSVVLIFRLTRPPPCQGNRELTCPTGYELKPGRLCIPADKHGKPVPAKCEMVGKEKGQDKNV
mmetsp:Transcript_27507/g.62389  ORF Transcript_27507/g.62389 Transcript_27507/m.62389 type:complete len:670 (-) Transcript_27507:2287-4296(-)